MGLSLLYCSLIASANFLFSTIQTAQELLPAKSLLTSIAFLNASVLSAFNNFNDAVLDISKL